MSIAIATMGKYVRYTLQTGSREGGGTYGYPVWEPERQRKPQVVVRSVSVDNKVRKKRPRVKIETVENGNGEINLKSFS
jgi:hypothetical protein